MRPHGLRFLHLACFVAKAENTSPEGLREGACGRCRTAIVKTLSVHAKTKRPVRYLPIRFILATMQARLVGAMQGAFSGAYRLVFRMRWCRGWLLEKMHS